MKDKFESSANIPIPVPHYWKDEVKKQLDEDEALGIIHKIPQGETTDWCTRMVVVSKRDGKPRRTVDFQPLNKYSKRGVHYTEPPFSAVSSIPLKMYKSSCDAFNGYHQVPLAETSIALTTFVTGADINTYVHHKAMYLLEMDTQGDMTTSQLMYHASERLLMMCYYLTIQLKVHSIMSLTSVSQWTQWNHTEPFDSVRKRLSLLDFY